MASAEASAAGFPCCPSCDLSRWFPLANQLPKRGLPTTRQAPGPLHGGVDCSDAPGAQARCGRPAAPFRWSCQRDRICSASSRLGEQSTCRALVQHQSRTLTLPCTPSEPLSRTCGSPLKTRPTAGARLVRTSIPLMLAYATASLVQ